MYFYDRADAGKKLGKLLAKKYKDKDIVIYALPRGGVVTAVEVAKIFHAPLDLIITRKIGHPFQPEYAIAATAENGHMIGNEKELARINKDWLRKEVKQQQEEAKRRREKYLGSRKPIDVRGKIAIIIDDGIATGLTMRVAILELKHKNPKKIIVAVPVAPKTVADAIRQEVNEFIALDIPSEDNFLGAIGAYYQKFFPVEDNEVISLMQEYEDEFKKSSQTSTKLDPVLFILPPYEYMTKSLLTIPNLTTGKFSLEQFPNGELYITLQSHVEKRPCIILSSLSPPEINLISFLFLSHTLKKENSQKITALIPYLAYSRHDKKEPLKSQATALIASLLSAVGVNEIITVDVHSPHVKKLFSIPLISLSTASIFAQEIKNLKLENATLVAPDEGAIRRCEAIAKELESQKKIVYMTKERTEKGIKHIKIYGKVGKKNVIIDDILDTGETLISCCKLLIEKGAEEITIMVTHGQFTGVKWKELWNLNVKSIYTTDTIPLKKQNYKNIHVISIIPLLTSELKEENKGILTINAKHRYDFYEYDEP